MLVLTNGLLFDGESDDLVENATVVVEGDRIREVTTGRVSLAASETLDLGGRFLMPGLIDNHFHVYSPTFDMQALDRMPRPLLVAYAARFLRDALLRGFTTVRDPGGGDIGLKLAIDRGLIDGPRFYYGGKALSQTGGHGDMRPPDHEEPCACAYSGTICQVVDGADEVRRVAREELRRGADHIKVFISGGVASPSDPLWMSQFSDEELEAAVEEAHTRRKYVIAHCHTDEGARRCARLGIRSIDHATQISDETARAIADSGTSYTVPTLAVLHQLTEYGADAGMAASSIAKADGLIGDMLASIESCRRAGVGIGLGTDIFGEDYHHLQSTEFRHRAEVDRPIDILRSATSINAEIMQRSGEVGVVASGALADLIVLETNPLRDISCFERHDEELALIMRGGDLIKNRLTKR